MSTGHVPDSNHLNPVIHRLHTEILWSIFNLNADINDDGPLETARWTSQVCNLWRSLMFASPGIWGQIVKLSELQVEKDVSPWRDAVMERTASAPLFIKGEIPSSRVEWFLGFMSTHWENIYHVNVKPIRLGEQVFYREKTDFMTIPPRNIAGFHLTHIGFDLQSSWVANLRSITLSTPFTTAQILDCLAKTDRLESAIITQWDHNSEISNYRQTISLPYLTDITVYHTFSRVLDILEHITPNAQCLYTIVTNEDPGIVSTTTRKDEIISGHFENCLNFHDYPAVHLKLLRSAIISETSGILEKCALMHCHLFTNISEVPVSEISRYLTIYRPSTSTSAKVRSLGFGIDNTCGDLSRFSDSFREFFRACPSLSTLLLSQRSLRFLTDILGDDQELILPALKELHLFPNDYTVDPGAEKLVAQFLNKRRLCGKNIATLYFSSNVTKLGGDWGFLQDFQDLKVFWLGGEQKFEEIA